MKLTMKTISLALCTFFLFLLLVYVTGILSSGSGNTTEVQAKMGGGLPAMQQKLEDIQAEKHALQNDMPELVTLVAVGDIMLSRSVEDQMKKYGNSYPFVSLAPFLAEQSVVFGNLESPLLAGKRVAPNKMVFRAPPESAEELARAHISVVSISNNHMMNQGKQGLEATRAFLQGAGVAFSGAGSSLDEATQVAIVEVKGLKIGFLAFTESYLIPASQQAKASQSGVAILEENTVKAAITKARSQVDILAVSMHFGQEYKKLPSKSQQFYAHLAIDTGADIVIGHHPHVVESVENYNGKLIMYSLGNCIFDQTLPYTREGALAVIQIEKGKITKADFLPLTIKNYAQAVIERDNKRAAAILSPLLLSQPSDVQTTNGEWLTFGKRVLLQ